MTQAGPYNLLTEACAAASDQPEVLRGYHVFDDRLAINLPAGHQVRLRVLPAQPSALLVESDLPEWISFEGLLWEEVTTARLALRVRAEREVMADLFLRLLPEGGGLIDGPVTRLLLGDGQPAEALLEAPEGAGRKFAVVLLRMPPLELVVDQLRLG